MGFPSPPPKQKKTYNLYNATHAMQPHAMQSHAVQPHAVQPHAVQPHAVQPICSAVSCSAAPCSATPCSAVPCSAAPRSATPCSADPCSATPCSAAHAVQPMQCSPCSAAHAVQPMQCSPCRAAQCSATYAFVVLFHSSISAYLFYVISISHGILANFWLMHVDLLIFKYNHTQFCFLAGILTNYYMMKHAVRLTCRLNL